MVDILRSPFWLSKLRDIAPGSFCDSAAPDAKDAVAKARLPSANTSRLEGRISSELFARSSKVEHRAVKFRNLGRTNATNG